MGTPVPPNSPTGGCGRCFGIGQILGEVQPLFLDVTFSEVQPGPRVDQLQGGLPHGKHQIIQQLGCIYRTTFSNFMITVSWEPANTIVEWRDRGGLIPFLGILNFEVCASRVNNDRGFGPFEPAFDGFAVISWNTAGL